MSWRWEEGPTIQGSESGRTRVDPTHVLWLAARVIREPLEGASVTRGSFFVLRDVLQRSEYASFDQGNLIRNQGGGGVHGADSSLDVVQAADGCGEQAAGNKTWTAWCSTIAPWAAHR